MAITSDDYQLQVELASVTNNAKDSIVNTWALKALDGSATFGAIATCFTTFYNALGSIFSPTLNPVGVPHRYRLYHLIEPEPRPPVYVSSFSRSGIGTPLPAEVAICTSIAADAPAGVRPARRRGRVYLGPINEGTGSVQNGYLRPGASVLVIIRDATRQLVEDLEAANWGLCVWSRADDGLFRVTHGWINNEYDTQRRRGPEPTGRDTWSV